MNKKKIILLFLVSSLVLLAGSYAQYVGKNRVQAIEGTNNPEGFIVEIDKTTGKIIKGKTDFVPDKPVIRPMYQGDASTLFDDVIGPKGKFTGFFDPSTVPTSSNSQKYTKGDTIIYQNVGRYNNRSLALKIEILGGGWDDWKQVVGITKDGELKISNPVTINPMYYQLVYNEANYPPVKDVYVDIPNELKVAGNNATQLPTVSLGSLNLKKVYLTIPPEWSSNQVKRSYTLEKNSASVPPSVEYFIMTFDNNNIETTAVYNTISDNNYRTLLQGGLKLNTWAYTTFFPVAGKSPMTPFYLAPQQNRSINSDKFEAKYDINQGVIDAYDTYLPKSVKIVVEDTKGYFKNLTHKPIQFTDKQNNLINLGLTTEIIDKKIVVTIPKVALKALKSNQVNMKLNFGVEQLNIDRVLENYESSKGGYQVPLTFYNIRTLDSGIESVSEKTDINATITPGIDGTPNGTTALIGSSSDDLDVTQLIKNSQSTIPGDSVLLSLPEKKVFDTGGQVTLPVKLQSKKNKNLNKLVNVQINVIRGEVVTSAFFENQTWLIDRINAQFAPRKIDKDIYQSDLLAIKKVEISDKLATYRGQHIPPTIKALKNLEFLAVNKMGLVGTLPAELGELKNLYHLAAGGNEIGGNIPLSLNKLLKLSYFDIANSKIVGTIPTGFVDLPELKNLFVNNTLLVGQIPTFSKVFNTSSFSNTQLTYNSAELPPFSGGKLDWFKYSFLPTEKTTLQLIGNKQVFSRIDTIKPFDPTNPGYFDLAIQKPGPEGTGENSTKEKLYPGHRYTIKDKESGKVLYEGLGEGTAEIVYRSKIEYQVTVDQAFDNPANNVTIQGKLPELKFSATPEKIQLKTRVNNDSTDTNLSLEGQLAVFDNRGGKNHWKLKMTPSSLSDNRKQLQGEYVYTDLNGNEKVIVDDQAMLLEQGTNREEETFSISNQWKDGKGLKYRLKPGNLLGNYKGTVMWSLEDAP